MNTNDTGMNVIVKEHNEEPGANVNAEWEVFSQTIPGLSLEGWPKDVLVVAPHPDDETLGCGGLIADLSLTGFAVRVVIVSDGSKSHDLRGIDQIRKAEAEHAAEALGVTSLVWAGFPDGQLDQCQSDIEVAIDSLLPKRGVVVSPRMHDGHSDHDAVAKAVTNVASKELGQAQSYWNYGVWTLANSPTVESKVRCFRHDLSARAMHRKSRALQAYASQVTRQYGHQIVTTELLEAAQRPFEFLWN
jgi:LmbE family N-acetylglucosaminyl deacetylase